MQFTLFALGALVATAACTPLAMRAAVEGQLQTRDDSNCTEYCSNSAGCVCTVRPSDCTAFYTVQPDDTCTNVAEKFGNFTVTQFYKWNPDVGQTCLGIRAYVPVCINTPWYTFTAPVQPSYGTHYTPDQTPVPLMPNTIASCQSFELVAPGTRVETLASENDFPIEKFGPWNGNSTVAYADEWACVKA